MDISKLLLEFPYDPEKLNVRLITADDGEPRIQVRLDLGLLQMHCEGRPDGQRPHGFDSLLEYYEDRLDQSQGSGGKGRAPAGDDDASEPASEPSETGGESPERFSLSPDDCEALRSEAVMYYHRYMALLALEDFEGVIRDTTRNLRVLDLCAQHAQTEQDRDALEQFRPYIMMMRARAMASQAIKDNEPKAALHAIDEGLEALRRHFAEHGEAEAFEQSGEVQMLKGMRDSLVPKLPVSLKTELRGRLARAIEQENYELAAILRDELRMLEKE